MRSIVNIAATALLALLPLSGWAAERPAMTPGMEHEHRNHDGKEGAGPPGGESRQGMRASREWTRYPLILPVMAPRGERGGNTLDLRNIAADVLDVYAPDGSPEQLRRQVPTIAGGTRVEPVSSKNGNYYWVTAREANEERVSVASTATFFSNPGAAPTALLLQAKHDLEIVPQPLPREHGSYRESEKWKFLLRYQGKPLAGKKLMLETEFGSRIAFTSDADGIATVLFPYDFKAEEPGKGGGHHGGPRRAKFVLAVEHEDGSKHYLTAFNYSYSPDAERGKNLWAGLGFGAFGMLLATPLLRRKKSNGEKSSQ